MSGTWRAVLAGRGSLPWRLKFAKIDNRDGRVRRKDGRPEQEQRTEADTKRWKKQPECGGVRTLRLDPGGLGRWQVTSRSA